MAKKLDFFSHFRSVTEWLRKRFPGGSKRSLRSKQLSNWRRKVARRFFFELLETRVVLASDWQNPLWNLDVDFDATVSPLDALVTINAINRQQGSGTMVDFSQPVGDDHYLDVDGDLTLSPLDVLSVVNYLNTNAAPVPADLWLLDDSGRSATDRITNNPVVTGTFFDDSAVPPMIKARLDRGPVVSLTIAEDNTFVFDPSTIATVLDGDRFATVFLQAEDGSIGYQRLQFSLDTLPPDAPSLALSSASGFVNARTSNASRVTLVGTTDPGETVTLIQPASIALSNAVGNFQFSSVSLSIGDNVFITQTTDVAGNTGQTSTTIQRVGTVSQSDPVLVWNQTLLQAVRADASDPTRASRSMAMVHTAIYDVVNAIENRTGYYATLNAPVDVSIDASISGAAHQVLSYLYPAQHESIDAVLATVLANVPDGSKETSSVLFGRQVGDSIIHLRANDGWDNFADYASGTEAGDWKPTEPMYVVALDPQWATLEPWAMTSPDQFQPPGSPSLSSLRWADTYNEVKALGSFNSPVRTADQTQIARFWANGAGTSTPPGHWNSIAAQVAAEEGNSIAENARLFAMLNVALADAAIVAWDSKYDDDFWRPITAIQNGDTDGNELTVSDPTWQPLLITPPFPEYVSGHSTFSGAAATVLTAVFGDDYAFSATSEGLVGVTRSFTSFDAAAVEAGRSRIYGGIHYEFSNVDGRTAGTNLANYVLKTFDNTSDSIAPRIFLDTDSGQAISTNALIVGRVLDNLSGVASLTASVDGGSPVPVSFDSRGQFSFSTSLSLDQTADGDHIVSFVAIDASGNLSDARLFRFTIDTVAPSLNIESPVAGADLAVGDLLSGSVGTSGSSIVAMSYVFEGQPAMPVAFDAQTGEFSTPLDFSKLAPGGTKLTISSRDAAGNIATSTIDLHLDERVDFAIARFTPLHGARDVGSTYRPQVFFSRPVNPASLTSANFYATGPSGAKLPANIVPSGDGTFAWLFFTQPMPAASQITVHLDGTTILAAGDDAPLDADSDGSPGGKFTYQFSTVSLTPLVGTSLSGKVLDVGSDLKPMTYDDVRVGPDQVMHTADDLFLLPIAGVKVFIVGLESMFTFTDANGNFHFDSVPAGNVKLAIDGRTATNAPVDVFFPEMVMDLMLEAGRANTVMGTMGTRDQQVANRDRQEVYLPRLQTSILQNVSGTAPTSITVVPEAAANITPEQRALLTLQVLPGSMRDQNGNVVTAGQVGISTVPPALVREMLPPGLLQHTFDITIQSPGITNFATPAPMTFPNLFGAKPGEQLNFLSFDHTTGRLVIEGSATVSADGLSISTNPGTGITHPGWHGLTPQGSQTRPDDDTDVAELGTEFEYSITTDVLSDRPPKPSLLAGSAIDLGTNDFSTAAVIQGVTDYLLTDPTERVRFSIENQTNPRKSNGAYLQVKFVIDPTIAHKYVDGLTNTIFKLVPGKTAKFDFTLRTPNILKLEHDVLIGVKYRLEISQVSKRGVRTMLPESGEYYAYRYVDAMDDDTGDGVLKFARTINDGAATVSRQRYITYDGDPLAVPHFRIATSDPATQDQFQTVGFEEIGNHLFATSIDFDPNLTFNPTEKKKNIEVSLEISTPTDVPRVVLGKSKGSDYQIFVSGEAVSKRKVYFNIRGLESALEELASGVTASSIHQIELTYVKKPGQQVERRQFILDYKGLRTVPINLDAEKGVVQQALERISGGPGTVLVEFNEALSDKNDIKSGPDKGGLSIKRVFDIKTPFINGQRARVNVVKPNPTDKYDRRASFLTNNLSLTFSPSERELIDTKEKRQRFAESVYQKFRDVLDSFRYLGSDGIEITRDSSADGPNIQWINSASDLYGLTPFGSAEDGDKLKSLLKDQYRLNVAQQGYALANALSGDAKNVEVYVDNHFEFTDPFWEVPVSAVTRELASTAAHEFAHSLGAPHTAKVSRIDEIGEIQSFSLVGGNPDDRFTLNLSGDISDLIRRDSTAEDIELVLRAMPTFRNVRDEVSVTKVTTDLFLVEFSKNSTGPSLLHPLRGVDMPLMSAAATGDLVVNVTNVRHGGYKSVADFEVKTNPSTGPETSMFDIMNSGLAGVETTFQKLVTRAYLQFSLGNHWEPRDTKAAVSLLNKILANRGNLSFERNPTNFVGEEPETFVNYGLEFDDGPLLGLFDDGSQLVDEATDFGSASKVTPSIRRFVLANLGTESATIRSVGIVRGIDAFSTSVIPVTVLEPGESLEFDITFSPDAVLDYEGTLSIDSDLPEFRGEFDLVGNGQPPNKPAIHLSASFNTLAPFYNNLQGAPVGELTSFTSPGSDNRPKLTNNGTAPLVITEIRVAAGQGFGEWMTPALTAPITLQPGESTGIGFSFRASKPGLRPGAFEVLSNDPRTPVLRIPVVATGVITKDNGVTYEGVDLGNDYVVVGDMLERNNNLPDLRTRSDDAGNWEFFLPAQTGITVVTFDPVSGLLLNSFAFTNASGVSTVTPRGDFAPSTFPDTDGDGLPDDVEFAVGTNPNKLDSDGDGKNDFAELDGGFNPIDDRPSANGIVSALTTGDSALDIKLAADFLDPARTIAYIASGSSGLTMVDVTDFARPITIAQLGSLGSVNNLSLDVGRKIIAGASRTSGISVIDVANPSEPKLLRSLPHEGTDNVVGVELYDGLVYVGAGGKLRVYEADSGEMVDEFSLGTQRITGMSRQGEQLYVTVTSVGSNTDLLRIFDLTLEGLTPRGSLTLPSIPDAIGGYRDPYVADNVAWIPATRQMVTVNVSQKDNPVLISSAAPSQAYLAFDFELNGSGLGVVAGASNVSGSTLVLQTPNPQTANQVFTQFALPAFGEAISLSSGLAYVASGISGLQLVNLLQRDTGLTPPTISLNPLLGDLDPGQLGVQLLEGSTVTIGSQITDDVQVQRVELLADGRVVRTELSYPYDLTMLLPTIAQTGNQVVLQVRATDTGGNVRLSEPIAVDLLADTTAPVLNSVEPADGSTQSVSRRKVTLQFSESLDPATLVPANFQLQGPNGVVMPISLTLRQRDSRLEILYPPLAEGAYTFITHATAVKDRASNPLGIEDIRSTFSVTAATRQPTIRWINDAGGQWSTASNWLDVATNTARLPSTTDNVLIDVPTDALITFSTGAVTVNSILSNERFVMSGGSLTVTDTIQVNNTFTLGVNQLFSSNIPTFRGTLLRGTGGQGLTLSGESRISAATLQTDVNVVGSAQLRLTGGLALTGTFTGPTAAGTNVQIGLEGSQTISSGTFVASEAAQNVGSILFVSLNAGNTLTFGQDVTLQGQFRIFNAGYYNPPPQVTTTLNVINYGTMKVGGLADTADFGIVLSTTADSFVNHGLLESQGSATLVLNAKTFTNATTGRIKIQQAAGSSLVAESLGAGGTSTSFVNAGTIEVINASARIMSRTDGLNETWSNAGTIIVDKSLLVLNGSFNSNDLVGIRNTGIVSLTGIMDNTGRTYTFTPQSGRYTLTSGRIKGGTLMMGGPTARLEFGNPASGPRGTLDGVTIVGDIELGGPFTDPISGLNFAGSAIVSIVENGLTLNGTASLLTSGTRLEFKNAQTLSGGVIQLRGGGIQQSVTGTGPLVIDSSTTIRTVNNIGGSLAGHIINNAPVVLGANSTLLMSGVQSATAPLSITNRGMITVPATSTLHVTRPFANEGDVVLSGGTMVVSDPSNNLIDPFVNMGTINLTGGGKLNLQTSKSDGRVTFRSADLGTIIDSGGFVQIEDRVTIDNTGSTLVVGGTASWTLTAQSESSASQIVGGIIQVASTAKFEVWRAGILKDVTVNGNVSTRFGMNLVGEIDVNGTLTAPLTLQLGHPTLYPGTPLVIRGGEFIVGGQGGIATITGYSTVPSIVLDPDVVLRGKLATANFAMPLTNRGQIIADRTNPATSGEVFHITAAPITNEGSLSAVNRSILRINTLAEPNRGIVSATAGSSVQFTNTFTQAATGTTRIDIAGTTSDKFGLVAIAGEASLEGTLEIQFAPGYVPTVGDRYKVLTYASRTGTFSSIRIKGLAAGLIATPQYNGTDITLVISAE